MRIGACWRRQRQAGACWPHYHQEYHVKGGGRQTHADADRCKAHVAVNGGALAGRRMLTQTDVGRRMLARTDADFSSLRHNGKEWLIWR